MGSGVGACRKTRAGTMCPSYMATRDEAHSTRGRANTLRLAMNGSLGPTGPRNTGLATKEVYDVLDLCLECRACKTECPVGVDMARFKSEFLADYWRQHGTPLRARVLGHIPDLSAMASRMAPLLNPLLLHNWMRILNERLFGIDRRRSLPAWTGKTLAEQWNSRDRSTAQPNLILFRDTFTNYYDPQIGMSAADVLETAGFHVGLGPDICCGRPLISQGLLADARDRAGDTIRKLYPAAHHGTPIVVLEPSCLSALVDDLPALGSGELQQQAKTGAQSLVLFEDFLEDSLQSGRASLTFHKGPSSVVLHGHCHQKSLGLVAPAKSLLGRIPDTQVVELDSGCCGMAGSFGYTREHFDISEQIGERRLLPAARALDETSVMVASGTSCRHQVLDFTKVEAQHPATLLKSLL